MCDCLEQTRQALLVSDDPERPYEVIEVVETLDTINFRTHETRKDRSYTTVKVRKKGGKRVESKKLFHSHCPFCGEEKI